MRQLICRRTCEWLEIGYAYRAYKLSGASCRSRTYTYRIRQDYKRVTARGRISEPNAVALTSIIMYEKYSHLEVTHCFIPVAVETLGAMGPEARSLFKEIACRIKITYGEERAHEFLLQRVAVAVQRGNAASVLGALRGPV